jgi:hypothetical protein
VVRQLPTAVSPAPPLTHGGADEGFAVYADREEITARLRRLIAGSQPADERVSRWQQALSDHLPHLVGELAGALVTDDRSVLDEAVLWLDDVMRHRDAPDSITDVVLDGLRSVMREHPVATRLLSGQIGSSAGSSAAG